jgi:hypothetical protein
VSQASDCMAYVFSAATKRKFETLMAAQQEPLQREQTPASPEEIKMIKDLRKKGLSFDKIAEMVGRSASCCCNACKR